MQENKNKAQIVTKKKSSEVTEPTTANSQTETEPYRLAPSREANSHHINHEIFNNM